METSCSPQQHCYPLLWSLRGHPLSRFLKVADCRFLKSRSFLFSRLTYSHHICLFISAKEGFVSTGRSVSLSVGLSVCPQNNSKISRRILVKFSWNGRVLDSGMTLKFKLSKIVGQEYWPMAKHVLVLVNCFTCHICFQHMNTQDCFGWKSQCVGKLADWRRSVLAKCFLCLSCRPVYSNLLCKLMIL